MNKSKNGQVFLDRFEELNSEREFLSEIPDEDDFGTPEEFQAACDDQVDSLADWVDLEEYEELELVVDEIDSNEWYIHEDEFKDIVIDMVMGESIPDWITIDWEATEDNVRSGYSVMEIGSDTYYYRS